jgi:hypothetical protein
VTDRKTVKDIKLVDWIGVEGVGEEPNHTTAINNINESAELTRGAL